VATTEHTSVSDSQPASAAGPHRATATSSSEADTRGERGVADDEEDAATLLWKLQVAGFQVAVLSTARLGTVHFAADRCSLSRSQLPTHITTEVRFSAVTNPSD
jgi:hypothetical protein